MVIALLIGGVLALGLIAVVLWRRTPAQAASEVRAARPGAAAARAPSVAPTGETEDAREPEEPPPYATDATQQVLDDCLKLAFGVTRFDYQIVGEHAAVLTSAQKAVAESVARREYFPRRPRQLPRLLQAINDTESTREELVRLILEDPALAGSVLQRANSAHYRPSAEPIESLDRAVVLLGTDGLRALMTHAILQPVFRLPKGLFDDFAEVTWELAERTAWSAEAMARTQRDADPFVAQLLGVMGALASMVLFRLTLEKYSDYPSVLPRAEVFIRVIQANRAETALRIGESWELSAASLAALDEQRRRVSPAHMSALGRAVYFGELCGAAMLLRARHTYSKEGAQALLLQQGAGREAVHAMERSARCPD